MLSQKTIGGSVFRATSKYPKCKIFTCFKSTYYSKALCCYFCDKKEQCSEKCLNHPKKCGMCVIPEGKEDEWPVQDYDDIPDHPDIARAERTGLKPGQKATEDDGDVICPVCRKACSTIYKDRYQEPFGCDRCVTRMDAWEWASEET